MHSQKLTGLLAGKKKKKKGLYTGNLPQNTLWRNKLYISTSKGIELLKHHFSRIYSIIFCTFMVRCHYFADLLLNINSGKGTFPRRDESQLQRCSNTSHFILSLDKKVSLIQKEEKLDIFWKKGQCLADQSWRFQKDIQLKSKSIIFYHCFIALVCIFNFSPFYKSNNTLCCHMSASMKKMPTAN